MNTATAKRWAKYIFDEFDDRIVEATAGTNVPPSFVAGLVFNEAGKDRKGNIAADATRFEKGVYAKLCAVRDGHLRRYNGIVRADIADAPDEAIRALATSYQATQIMGWHVIHNLGCTIADLRDPKKHFFFTVKLLQLNGFPRNATDERMADEMRQWNTGREDGKTYHANYVANAKAIRDAYRKIEAERPAKALISATAPAQADNAQSVTEVASASSFAEGEPSSTEQSPTATETKTVEAPPPTGFLAKLKMHLVGLGLGTGTVAALKEWFGIQLSPETVELLKIVIPTVLGLGFLGFVTWFIAEKVVGYKTLKMKSEIASDPTRADIEIKGQ